MAMSSCLTHFKMFNFYFVTLAIVYGQHQPKTTLSNTSLDVIFQDPINLSREQKKILPFLKYRLTVEKNRILSCLGKSMVYNLLNDYEVLVYIC